MSPTQERFHRRMLQTLPVRTVLGPCHEPAGKHGSRALPEEKLERMRELDRRGVQRKQIAVMLKVGTSTLRRNLGPKFRERATKKSQQRLSTAASSRKE